MKEQTQDQQMQLQIREREKLMIMMTLHQAHPSIRKEVSFSAIMIRGKKKLIMVLNEEVYQVANSCYS